MAKVTKKQLLSAKGVLYVTADDITLEVEDVETPMSLKDLLESFNEQEVTITVNHADDVV